MVAERALLGTLARPVPQPGGTVRVIGLGLAAAAVVLRPLVPDGGGGLVLEALILCCAAAALAMHWIAAAGGFKPTWRRPVLGIAAGVVALGALGLWWIAPDWWPGALAAGGRIACLLAFAVALQQGDEASGGALVRGCAAAGVLALAAAAVDGAHGLAGRAPDAAMAGGAPSLIEWPALRAPADLPLLDQRGAPGRAAWPALTGDRLAAVGVTTTPLLAALLLLAAYDERGRTGRALRTTLIGAALALVAGGTAVAGGLAAVGATAAALGVLALAARRHLPAAEGRPRFLWPLVPLGAGLAVAFAAPWIPGGRAPSPLDVEPLPALARDRAEAWSRVPTLLGEGRWWAGVGAGGYAAADAAVPLAEPAAGAPPRARTVAASAGSTPLTLAVEWGVPFALGWLAVLAAALACARVAVPAPAVDPAQPPPRWPIRPTTAATAVALGGVGALLLPLATGRLLPLAEAVLLVPLWVGLAGVFACPERPGLRPFPPLLRAAAIAAAAGALAYGLVSDAMAWPGAALGVFVLAGVAAATPWTPPADERPERPPRPVARAAAWAVPAAVAAAAAVGLPLAGAADQAIAAALAASPERRFEAGDAPHGHLAALPASSRSATLEALRGLALTSVYAERLGSPPTLARVRAWQPLLDEGLSALGEAQRAWRTHPAPAAASAAVHLRALADIERVLADDPGAAGDPALRAWRARLQNNAVRDARLAAQLLPGSPRARWMLARALLADGNMEDATRALQEAEALRASAPPGVAPSDDEMSRVWRRLHAPGGG